MSGSGNYSETKQREVRVNQGVDLGWVESGNQENPESVSL